MSIKDIKKIIDAAESLKEYCDRNDVSSLNFNVKPFENLLELLYPALFKHKFYNDELYFYGVEEYFLKKNKRCKNYRRCYQ